MLCAWNKNFICICDQAFVYVHVYMHICTSNTYCQYHTESAGTWQLNYISSFQTETEHLKSVKAHIELTKDEHENK